MSSWESAHFHLGKFYDQRFARMKTAEKDSQRYDFSLFFIRKLTYIE